MQVVAILNALLLFSLVSVSAMPAAYADPTANAASAQTSLATDSVAVLNGMGIPAAELDAHVKATGLPREEALEDLINLVMLRDVATNLGLKIPAGAWSPDERAGIEYAVAKGIGMTVSPLVDNFIVDHAWIKDAKDKKRRRSDRADIERLRALVQAGATIPQAFQRLNVNGRMWHIGDHEEYPSDVLPPAVRHLAAGTLTPIVPGDGGLHLFRIYEVKPQRPPIDEIRAPLFDNLRQVYTIERPKSAH